MATFVPPKKNVAYITYVALVSQANTKLFQAAPTLAAGDAQVSIDGGAFANLATLPVVTPAAGRAVKVDLSAAEMNGDNIVLQFVDAAGAQWCDLIVNLQTTARQIDDLAFPATSGRSLVVDAAGLADANMVKVGPTGAGTAQTAGDIMADTNDIQARLPAALVAGRIDASVGAMAAGVVTAAAVATGAIDADALASDAVTEIRSVSSGTADSGTTTTMVDAARTEADTDYWKGDLILFTSGTILGQVRLITAFNPATDTITFAPATTQAVGTNTYEIIPAGRADLHLWLGIIPDALSSGKIAADLKLWLGVVPSSLIAGDLVNAAVSNIQAGVITAAAIATDAIDADALATDAVNEIADGWLNRDMAVGTDTIARSPRNALRFLRNKRATAAGTLTVTKEDDVTTAWTAALTTDAAAVPVITVDPA